MTFSCHWIYACMLRERLRTKYGLPSDPCNDCCVHFCCEACALCQEHAELKHRGLDPSKGWIGPPNVPPRMPPSMERV
ncbi:putative PLAC8 motif-containing protein [Helianthus annuus]|nr:putative PLAC8 motif-containing protein [Helianthus annuus]